MNDPRRVDIVGHVALVVLAAVFAAGLSRSVVRPFLDSRREAESYRQALSTLSGADWDLDRLDENLDAIEREIEACEAMLPSELSVDVFLGEIGDLAAEEGVTVDHLAPSAVRSHPLYRELLLDIEVTGPFLSIARFVARLEAGDRITRIERLRIEPEPERESCRAEISLALYFAPQPEV